MTQTRRVCLVTSEIYPFTIGGIGRLTHNLIRDSLDRQAPIEFHLLVPASTRVDARTVEACYGGKVQLHHTPPNEGNHPSVDLGATYPPPWALSVTPGHAQSMACLRSLKALAARGLTFDVVEFPDYHGWAFCTLQEKLLGLDFEHTEISVRLHSTAGIIEHFERRHLSQHELGRFEIERKSLLDAERVIAHLAPIAGFNREYYGLPASWSKKVSVEFPPVAERKKAPGRQTFEAGKNLVFASKIQPFKRPDLFVRGAVTFMSQCPEFTGRAIFATHQPEPHYLEETRALIPSKLRERFLFLYDAGPERERLLGSSLVVIPSDYESVNLLVYEASAAGGVPIVNATCPGFGDQTPLIDGENCHKFDGTAADLARALQRAWRAPAIEPIAWTAATPYWEKPPRATKRPAPRKRPPLVSVVITNFNLGLHLPEALASVAASSHPDVETIVVDDASSEPLDDHMLELLERDPQSNVTVIRNPVNLGLCASRNVGVRHAKGDYILPLDADDCISPTFLELGVRALETHREFDVVVPTAAYFKKDEEIPEQRFCDYATFLGDVPTLGLIANRFSCATSLMRSSIFGRFAYNERLTSYEDWDLYLRLALDGRRFLVTNELHFFYRRRANSMIGSVTPQRHSEILARMYEALPRPLPPAAHFFALAAPAPVPPAAQREGGPLAERPYRHEIIDGANAALKRVPAVHSLLKQTLSLARGLSPNSPDGLQKPLRHEIADTLNSALGRMPRVKNALRRRRSPPSGTT